MEQNYHHLYLCTAAAVKYQAKGTPVQCRMVSRSQFPCPREEIPISSPLEMKPNDQAILLKGKPLAVSEASEVGRTPWCRDEIR